MKKNRPSFIEAAERFTLWSTLYALATHDESMMRLTKWVAIGYVVIYALAMMGIVVSRISDNADEKPEDTLRLD